MPILNRYFFFYYFTEPTIGLVSRQTEMAQTPLFVDTLVISLFLFRIATSTSALTQEENITEVERVSPHRIKE